MTRKILSVALCSALILGNSAELALARGFGGGGGRGFGGFGGARGFSGGMGAYRGGFSGGVGGYRGGYAGNYSANRGDFGGYRYGGMPSYNSGASFNASRSFGASTGTFHGYNPYAAGAGARGGSYTTGRGTTIDYGAAGAGVVGPRGGAAGRGVGGVQVTTPGGRSFTDVGRAAGAVGPGGSAVGTRSNLAVGTGPRGTAVSGSRGFAATGAAGTVAGRSAFGAAGFRPYGYNNFAAYHSGWVHGYWNGQNNAAWGWRNNYWNGWGWGLGAGLGWGLASWGFGSMLYGWGYMPYSNPYYVAPVTVVNQPVAVYDYSQPIDTVSPAPSEEVADPAMASFDEARTAFREGNYDRALSQTDQALAKLPNDTILHQFRALCLFALQRYDEAAATLYAVLAVGPGWDWTTMIGLYPDIDTYTAQLRALEQYSQANESSAAARFDLAYLYLTAGQVDAAVGMLKQVVALKPNDTLSAKLLRQLDTSQDKSAAPSSTSAPTATAAPSDTATAPATPSPDTPPATPTPAETPVPAGATIAGAWQAKPADDTQIDLSIGSDNRFTWKVTTKGKPQEFSGTSTFANGILTLAQDKGPVLVGRVNWQDPTHMTFRVVGDGPDDPGLSFSK